MREREKRTVEGNVVAEVRVFVEQLAATVASTVALVVASKEVDDAVLDLFSDLREVHVITAAGRAFTVDRNRCE